MYIMFVVVITGGGMENIYHRQILGIFFISSAFDTSRFVVFHEHQETLVLQVIQIVVQYMVSLHAQ